MSQAVSFNATVDSQHSLSVAFPRGVLFKWTLSIHEELYYIVSAICGKETADTDGYTASNCRTIHVNIVVIRVHEKGDVIECVEVNDCTICDVNWR